MNRAIPVAEVFGPTIQGEGPDAGRPCYFVRYGGCDYSCSWCDSLIAVEPASVRNLPKLDGETIITKLVELGAIEGSTVVLSGGNPVLHELGPMVDVMLSLGWRPVVETQGSRWKSWLRDVSLVVCSPKPPSSGMTTDWQKLDLFVRQTVDGGLDADHLHRLALKVVVGDMDDYEYAVAVHRRYPDIAFYASVLNPAGSDGEAFDLGDVLARYRWLCEQAASDARMVNARVMPQLHTLAWGSEMGR